LFSIPEYAGGMPGAFKNLLDWLIGDDQPGSIYEKPVAWMNASPRGAELAHESLRIVLGYAHATIVEEACIHVPIGAAAIDDAGLVSDPALAARITAALALLAAYTVT
jgi:NAD(P)H-dependent FMN reductase